MNNVPDTIYHCNWMSSSLPINMDSFSIVIGQIQCLAQSEAMGEHSRNVAATN